MKQKRRVSHPAVSISRPVGVARPQPRAPARLRSRTQTLALSQTLPHAQKHPLSTRRRRVSRKSRGRSGADERFLLSSRQRAARRKGAGELRPQATVGESYEAEAGEARSPRFAFARDKYHRFARVSAHPNANAYRRLRSRTRTRREGEVSREGKRKRRLGEQKREENACVIRRQAQAMLALVFIAHARRRYALEEGTR